MYSVLNVKYNKTMAFHKFKMEAKTKTYTAAAAAAELTKCVYLLNVSMYRSPVNVPLENCI